MTIWQSNYSFITLWKPFHHFIQQNYRCDRMHIYTPLYMFFFFLTKTTTNRQKKWNCNYCTTFCVVIKSWNQCYFYSFCCLFAFFIFRFHVIFPWKKKCKMFRIQRRLLFVYRLFNLFIEIDSCAFMQKEKKDEKK